MEKVEEVCSEKEVEENHETLKYDRKRVIGEVDDQEYIKNREENKREIVDENEEEIRSKKEREKKDKEREEESRDDKREDERSLRGKKKSLHLRGENHPTFATYPGNRIQAQKSARQMLDDKREGKEWENEESEEVEQEKRKIIEEEGVNKELDEMEKGERKLEQENEKVCEERKSKEEDEEVKEAVRSDEEKQVNMDNEEEDNCRLNSEEGKNMIELSEGESCLREDSEIFKGTGFETRKKVNETGEKIDVIILSKEENCLKKDSEIFKGTDIKIRKVKANETEKDEMDVIESGEEEKLFEEGRIRKKERGIEESRLIKDEKIHRTAVEMGENWLNENEEKFTQDMENNRDTIVRIRHETNQRQSLLDPEIMKRLNNLRESLFGHLDALSWEILRFSIISSSSIEDRNLLESQVTDTILGTQIESPNVNGSAERRVKFACEDIVRELAENSNHDSCGNFETSLHSEKVAAKNNDLGQQYMFSSFNSNIEEKSTMKSNPLFSSHQNSSLQLQPSSRQNNSLQLQPSSRQNSSLQLQPSSRQNNSIQLQPSSHQNNSIQLQLSSNQNNSIQLQPSSHQNSSIQLQPSSRQNNSIQPQPSSRQNNSIQPSPHLDCEDFGDAPLLSERGVDENSSHICIDGIDDGDEDSVEIDQPESSLLRKECCWRWKQLPRLQRVVLIMLLMAAVVGITYALVSHAQPPEPPPPQQDLPSENNRTPPPLPPHLPKNIKEKETVVEEDSQRDEGGGIQDGRDQIIPPPGLPQKISARQEAVVGAMKHAWKGYKTYAWGHDHLKPVSRSRNDWLHLGLTLIDALDTLWIMDLKEEFSEAREWVATQLNFNLNQDVNLFETTIRVLGGLLSTYHLTKEQLFLDKAIDLGDRLVGGFTSTSGVPYADVNLYSRRGSKPKWGPDSSTSEVTTIQLEFRDLSRVTGNPIYEEKSSFVSEHIHKLPKTDGLVPIFINAQTGEWRSHSTITLGARGDSYYEYLLKQWIQTGKTKNYLRDDYNQSVTGMERHLAARTHPSKLLFFGELHGSTKNFVNKMDELTCYLPGTLALGWHHGMPHHHLTLAQELIHTCVQTWLRQPTNLAPEITHFYTQPSASNEDFYVKANDAHYLLRPETIESLWYLYQLTGNTTYQDWGWQMFQGIETYCRVENGYTSIGNVRSTTDPKHKDKMESFFLGETLKYLYLLFMEDQSAFSVDKWVFNSEAHPLPIHPN